MMASAEKSRTRLRLLVVTSTYPRWADDSEPAFVHELAKRLAEHCDVLVVCPHADRAAMDEVLDGVRVHRYRYAPRRWETLVNHGGMLANVKRHPWKWLLVPGFLLGQWICLLRYYYRWRPHLIHAHWLLPQGMVAALTPARPLVVTSHGADLFALKGSVFAALRAFIVKRVAVVTVVSDAMRKRIRAENPVVNACVMPMGVDMDGRFTADAGMQRSANIILAVGRLVEKKGLIYLIEAMPDVLAVHPDARLQIVGFGPEGDRLKQRVHQLGLADTVQFMGACAQPDLPPYYRAAAVFVAPFVETASGDQEGLGLVVAEAIGCLCPVLVGDVPAVHDLVGDEADCLVPQRDAKALAAAIIRVLDDPATAARQALERRRIVQRTFSWHAVAENYLRLFESALEQGRCHRE